MANFPTLAFLPNLQFSDRQSQNFRQSQIFRQLHFYFSDMQFANTPIQPGMHACFPPLPRGRHWSTKNLWFFTCPGAVSSLSQASYRANSCFAISEYTNHACCYIYIYFLQSTLENNQTFTDTKICTHAL